MSWKQICHKSGLGGLSINLTASWHFRVCPASCPIETLCEVAHTAQKPHCENVPKARERGAPGLSQDERRELQERKRWRKLGRKWRRELLELSVHVLSFYNNAKDTKMLPCPEGTVDHLLMQGQPSIMLMALYAHHGGSSSDPILTSGLTSCLVRRLQKKVHLRVRKT